MVVMPASSEMALHTAIGRCAHTFIATIGSLARRSCQTNRMPAMTKATTPQIMVALWLDPTSVSASISPVTEMVKNKAPGQSTLRR
jgi:hypothetical protein